MIAFLFQRNALEKHPPPDTTSGYHEISEIQLTPNCHVVASSPLRHCYCAVVKVGLAPCWLQPRRSNPFYRREIPEGPCRAGAFLAPQQQPVPLCHHASAAAGYLGLAEVGGKARVVFGRGGLPAVREMELACAKPVTR